MTENEAIEVLNNFDMQVSAKADGAYQSTIGKNACRVAVDALKEIQQYRAIGTVEECRETRERQIPEKPEIINGGISVCPVCGAKVLRCYDFCKDCGNAIDWSE